MKVKIIDEKIQKSIDELVHKVYERGYDDGYKVIPSVYYDNYEKGMSEIWEYIKRLGKLTINDMCEIFGEGYDKKMAEERSLIAFIRKKDSIETPYVTAEIVLQGSPVLTQLYGDHDSKPDKEVFAFANEFLNQIKKVRKAKA
jgi:hypothetical protein